MKRKSSFYGAAGLLIAFMLWTAAVCLVDVRPIGPQNSAVGFAILNGLFHDLTGVNMTLYTVTDWLSLIPFVFVAGFALLGLAQWIKRKSIKNVDRSILILGGFYLVVMAAYLLFEVVTVNYRPVLINGVLETSYPSSTTMLVLCVMPTAILQLNDRLHNRVMKHLVGWSLAVFTAFMLIGRTVSGVHWLTDIVGGILLSAALVMLYRAAVKSCQKH